MRALVLFESLFGNTGAVAEAVAEGLRVARPGVEVECRRVDDPVAQEGFDLLVLGAPTHFWGLTGAMSRAMESQYERRLMGASAVEAGGATRSAAATSGMRKVLASLPPGRGRIAAAFDTCMTGPLTGGARRRIARKLERVGYRLLAEPETFLVEAVAGPLRPGEIERARDWGCALAALAEQDIPNWRTTMETQTTNLHDGPREVRSETPALPAPRGVGHQTPVLSQGVPRDRVPIDVTRILTTTEVVLGAVLVARYLSRRPGSTKALVTMGPGGWVSMKGGAVAVRRGSRPWARPAPLQATATSEQVPLWARVLSAVPLQALMR